MDRKFLDLFLSIHGQFFLQNPRSSFSWQVFVVRVGLGLGVNYTVPVLVNNDLFVREASEVEGKRGLFVGWRSVQEAYDHMLQDSG